MSEHSDTDAMVPVDWPAELAKHGIEDFAPGDSLINRDGDIYIIKGFGRDSYGKPCIVAAYPRGGTSHIRLDDVSLENGHTPKYVKLYADVDTVFQEAVERLSNPAEAEPAEDTATTSLTIASGKATVEAHRRMLQDKENRLTAMEAVMKRKMGLLRHQSTILGRQLQYAQQIIRLIELFLGVYEKIVTLRQGQPAPAEFPINIRQLVLYMDEEVGTIQFFNGQRGIDFQSIEQFDQWLLEDQSHIDLVIPEAKSIVALKPTRQDREYSPHFLVNLSMKNMNNFLYLLVRNGENLYRVYTDITIGDRLFPTEDEMQAILDNLEAAEELSNKEAVARSQEMNWRYKSALIQGLLERTTVLHPLPAPDVSLFNPESFERGHITLIRDAEDLKLPDGRVTFKEWREQANAGIKLGSRVIITDAAHDKYESNRWRDGGVDGWAWRFGGNYYHWTPEPPPNGVYVVEQVQRFKSRWISEERDHFRIYYMPGDRTRYRSSWDPEPRRQGLWIEARDEFVLNYDAFNMEDINYYVSNRIYRREYLSIIPQLFNLRDLRLAEIEEEKLLVENFAKRYEVPEPMVWDALNWWKRKNKLQRPMREDESKAWRMIRRRLKV